MRCAVFSDDLTGAHNVGVEFARHGLKTLVVSTVPPATDADVLIINTNSRHLPPLEAYQVVAEAAQAVCETYAPEVYVKKMDSLLRGNLGAEIDAVLDTTGLDHCLVVNASPALGRTTVGGYQLVNGQPVNTRTQLDPTSSISTAHVPTRLAEQSRRLIHPISLLEIAHSQSLTHKLKTEVGIFVSDATDNATINLMVQKGYRLFDHTGIRCFAGTYGLGSALCRALLPPQAPVLVVVGSLSDASKRQVEVLKEDQNSIYLPLNVTTDLKALTTRAHTAAELPLHLIFHLEADPRTLKHAEVIAGLQAAVRPVLDLCVGFVATGGATAQALYDLLEADGLHLEAAELFTGTPAARVVGGPHAGKPFLAKPGAQGDDMALVTLLEQVQAMRRQSVL